MGEWAETGGRAWPWPSARASNWLVDLGRQALLGPRYRSVRRGHDMMHAAVLALACRFAVSVPAIVIIGQLVGAVSAEPEVPTTPVGAAPVETSSGSTLS